jgi:hypothetical protein
MSSAIRTRTVLALLSTIVLFPRVADAFDRRAHARALDAMMVAMAPESARDSKAIKAAYREHLDLLVINQYDELQAALYAGGLAPLPADPVRFNLAPRLTGPSPIGEKDLHNQTSYIAARPATIGALLDVASRVKSGPLEITSLVRHTEYQGALRATNGNAITSVPMHTMGLAFDIALINTPIKTVYEIRDVLRRMRSAGEILFIGERQQLVFHVVPQPARLGHFTEAYARALGAPPAASGTPVVAFSPSAGPTGTRTATVTAEVIAVLPTREFVDEWWAADDPHGDLAVEVAAVQEMMRESEPDTPTAPRRRAPVASMLLLIAATLAATWWMMWSTSRRAHSRLFQPS